MMSKKDKITYKIGIVQMNVICESSICFLAEFIERNKVLSDVER